VYNQQKLSCRHSDHDQAGVCKDCGKVVEHSFFHGVCGVCGKTDPTYVAPEVDYFLFGYINGKDYACGDDFTNMGEYKFVNGTLIATFETESYVAVKEEDNKAWYMSTSYIQEKSGEFYNTDTGANEKMWVPGGVELIFHLTKNEDGSLTLSYEEAAKLQTISGKVTSAAQTEGDVIIELWLDGDMVPSYTTVVTDGSYRFDSVPVGDYILMASKPAHVGREYVFTLEEKPMTLDVKLCPIGDATGDGRVNAGDVAKLFAYIKSGSPLKDEYAEACANANGGKLNIGDVSRIYAHVTGKNPLF
jgi:hypothetical protein